MRFEAMVAWRYVVSARGQTGLTVAAVGAAVCLIIFINCLILGVQARFIQDLIGSIAHISVKVPDPDPIPLSDTDEVQYSVQVEKQLQQRSDLRRPEALEKILLGYPHVEFTAASVGGQAFLIRGVRQFGVTVRGADPVKQDGISNLSRDMLAGRWLSIGTNDIVIGKQLADDTGVRLGETVTLVSSEQVMATLTVAGIYSTGQNQLDRSTVFVNLRGAQRLFATGTDASSISLKLDDPFQANRISRIVEDSLGLRADSWMVEQAQFVNAFAAQNGTRIMISVFSLLASAFGIASVLVVSVFQRARQIGIMKSMGATDIQILRIFTLQGLFVSVLGALLGALGAFGLLTFLTQFKQVAPSGRSDQLFPAVLDPGIFMHAMLAAVVATMIASYLPARRAAKTNPVEVISEG